MASACVSAPAHARYFDRLGLGVEFLRLIGRFELGAVRRVPLTLSFSEAWYCTDSRPIAPRPTGGTLLAAFSQQGLKVLMGFPVRCPGRRSTSRSTRCAESPSWKPRSAMRGLSRSRTAAAVAEVACIRPLDAGEVAPRRIGIDNRQVGRTATPTWVTTCQPLRRSAFATASSKGLSYPPAPGIPAPASAGCGLDRSRKCLRSRTPRPCACQVDLFGSQGAEDAGSWQAPGDGDVEPTLTSRAIERAEVHGSIACSIRAVGSREVHNVALVTLNTFQVSRIRVSSSLSRSSFPTRGLFSVRCRADPRSRFCCSPLVTTPMVSLSL